MINYYDLLGINKDLTEKQLQEFIEQNILRLKNIDANRKEKIYAIAAISFLKKFKHTIENYGSKENYDIALKKSKGPFKIVRVKTTKVLKNTKYKLTATSLSVFAAFGIAASLTGNDINEFNVEIPTYGESIEQVCDELGISPFQLKLSDILNKHDSNQLDSKNNGKLNVRLEIKTKELDEKTQEFKEKVSTFAEQYKDRVITYKVGKKDNIWKICDEYELNIDDVLNLNKDIDNIFSLNEGQIIKIPHYDLGYNIKK